MIDWTTSRITTFYILRFYIPIFFSIVQTLTHSYIATAGCSLKVRAVSSTRGVDSRSVYAGSCYCNGNIAEGTVTELAFIV